MVDSYENLQGMIWVDGELVQWKDAKFHLLTHALHYGSSVFEGERAYGGRIYKSKEHSSRLIRSGQYVDINIPYSIDDLEEAKKKVLKANKQKDSYVRALAWRGSGPDMGVASSRNPVKVAIASWEWGAYYGDAKIKADFTCAETIGNLYSIGKVIPFLRAPITVKGNVLSSL